jgi:ribosomal protein L11 methyltransferase
MARVDWKSLSVEVPVALADAVASFLFDEGARGVITVDGGARVRLETHLGDAEHARVAAALGRYLASLATIAPEARSAIVASGPLPPVDWEAAYRQHHRPVAVGRTLVVAPPWDVPVTGTRHLLVIEPGMAFGTGQHATTRGCLEAIEDAVATGRVASALDVGTGSGLLAAALVRLGVPRVVALDVDPATAPVARANLARNGAGRAALLVGPAAAVRARFDLVVANLLADALLAEADVLAARVAPGGRLVVSGLLDGQVEAVVAAYPGFHPTATRSEDAWRTVVLARGDG